MTPVAYLTLHPRGFYAAIALLCAALLGYGYWLQFAEGLEPCPLCVFQRLCYMAVGAIAVVGAVHGPGAMWRRLYSGVLFLAAAIGAGIAGRQVWLQHLPPDQVPECGPGLDYMLDVFPLSDALRMAFTGSGECAEVDWTFLSLSIAEWSLFWFLAVAAAAALHALRS
ncbi:MAG TPA: disulfide bond formation protein B [Gammaproteobacteria bacterium]